MEGISKDVPGYVLTRPNGNRFIIAMRPDSSQWFMSYISSSEPYETVHLADFVDASRAMAFIGYYIAVPGVERPKKRWWRF